MSNVTINVISCYNMKPGNQLFHQLTPDISLADVMRKFEFGKLSFTQPFQRVPFNGALTSVMEEWSRLL